MSSPSTNVSLRPEAVLNAVRDLLGGNPVVNAGLDGGIASLAGPLPSSLGGGYILTRPDERNLKMAAFSISKTGEVDGWGGATAAIALMNRMKEAGIFVLDKPQNAGS